MIKYSENITAEQIELLMGYAPLKRLQTTATETFELQKITVMWVKMFGSRIGFVGVEVVSYDTEGNSLPGYCILRGDAVAIIPVLKTEKGDFTILVEQARVPVGKYIQECPAGMMDKGLGVVETAFAELSEETGLDVNIDDANIIDIGEYYTSPGILDEKLHIKIAEIAFKYDDLKNIDNSEADHDEDEHINITICSLDEALIRCNNDFKTTIGILKYKEMQNEKA